MSKILGNITIKFDLRQKGKLLAIVTLNFNDEFEIRYCRITKKANGILWFQPPALRDFGWAKCFIVLKTNDWKLFQQKVIDKLFDFLQEQVNKGNFPLAELEKLKNGQLKQDISEEDYKEINKKIT